MSDDEIRDAFTDQSARLDAKIAGLLAAVGATLDRANAIQSESEARAAATDRRSAAREMAYDERNNRAEARAERQAVAWERIADALAAIAARDDGQGGT